MHQTDKELRLTANEAAELAQWLSGHNTGHLSGATPPPLPELPAALAEALNNGASIHCEGPGRSAAVHQAPSTVADGRHSVTGDRATVSTGSAPASIEPDRKRQRAPEEELHPVSAAKPESELTEEEKQRRDRFPHGDAGRKA